MPGWLCFTHHVSAGIEHEETLLSESAARETSLNTQIIEVELEHKLARVEVERLKNEKVSQQLTGDTDLTLHSPDSS